MRRYTILKEHTVLNHVIRLDEGLEPAGIVCDINNPCCSGRPVVICRLKSGSHTLYDARCACGRSGLENFVTDPLQALMDFVGEPTQEEMDEAKPWYEDD